MLSVAPPDRAASSQHRAPGGEHRTSGDDQHKEFGAVVGGAASTGFHGTRRVSLGATKRTAGQGLTRFAVPVPVEPVGVAGVLVVDRLGVCLRLEIFTVQILG